MNSSDKTKVSDFMAKEVVSISPDMSLVEAANLLYIRGFNGAPVVDAKNKLIGILTEYDLIQKGSSLHIPTFLKLIKEFDVYRKDKQFINDELKKIFSVKVKDVMNCEPLTINPDADIDDAARLFSEHHKVNPIPVTNRDNTVAGVISRCDILRLYAPSPDLSRFLKESSERRYDKEVNVFLKNFERKFVFVSKSRTRFWLLFSMIFLVVGFIAALVWTLTVKIKVDF